MIRDLQFKDETLFLRKEGGRLEWKPRCIVPGANVSQPQLKLFASELAFLTMAMRRLRGFDPIVVYAGAALGQHIPTLARLFPTLEFFLYDPHRFAFPATKQLRVIRDYFTDDTARKWAESGKTIIFISDIRKMTTEIITAKRSEREKEVGVEMQEQAEWVKIMQPAGWSLKFRIPYPIVEKGEQYHYLGGELMMQPFTRGFCTELRLIGDARGAKAGCVVAYDSREIEQLLFYHNMIVRPNKDLFCNVYSLDEDKYEDKDMDHGYDTTYLLYVIERYVSSSLNSISSDLVVGIAANLALAKTICGDFLCGKFH